MRITFVFEDGVMDTKENREIFELALNKALKNVDDIFTCDLADIDGGQEWRSQFYERRKTGDSNDSWRHNRWVIDKKKLSPLGAEKLGRPYIPEKLYLEYFKWYFGRWIMTKQIIDII